jgi:cell division protein FtsQ
VVVAWWVTNSRAFDVRTLQVDGNAHLTSDEVVRLASLTKGTNVLWMSTEEVEQRLESDPWIQSADVTRALPSAVTISVRERSAVAIIRGRNPSLVAGDGTVLGEAGAWVRLPLIDPPGRHRTSAPVTSSDVRLSVARALSPRLREMVARVSVRGSAITLELRSGVRVLLGEPSGTRAKLETLSSVLAWAARHGISPEYIDVRISAVPALMAKA